MLKKDRQRNLEPKIKPKSLGTVCSSPANEDLETQIVPLNSLILEQVSAYTTGYSAVHLLLFFSSFPYFFFLLLDITSSEVFSTPFRYSRITTTNH